MQTQNEVQATFLVISRTPMNLLFIVKVKNACAYEVVILVPQNTLINEIIIDINLFWGRSPISSKYMCFGIYFWSHTS